MPSSGPDRPLTISLPRGRWGVAVSGGADSVALLRLAVDAAGPEAAASRLRVLHLDHETRGGQSAADADFVARLAASLGLPATIATRSAVESSLSLESRNTLSTNLSARYRAARLGLFRRAAADHRLDGVLLAHHADDQAETVLLRLIRGSGYPALAAMAGGATVDGVALVRPLLGVRRAALREYLTRVGQDWREDASNAADDYARNRARKALAGRPDVAAALADVAAASAAARDWVAANTPHLPDTFATAELAALPDALAAAAAAGWLRRRGVGGDDASPAHVAAVVRMCQDAAAPARHAAPGGVLVRRRRGVVTADPPTSTRRDANGTKGHE